MRDVVAALFASFLRHVGVGLTPVVSPQGRQVRNSPRSRAHKAYVAVLGLAGLTLWSIAAFLAATREGHYDGPDGTMVLFLFTCVAFLPGVAIRRGHEFLHHRFWEFPIIAGLYLAPPTQVTFFAATVFGVVTAIGCVVDPKTWDRAITNLGSAIVSVALGVAIASIQPPWTYPIGYVAIIVLRELIAYGYDVARGEKRYGQRAAPAHLGRRVVVSGSLVSIITLYVHYLGAGREFWLLLPLGIVATYWTVRWRTSIMEEQSAWQHMESVSSKFIGELEEHKAIAIALEEALKMFGAQRVEITLPPDCTNSGSRYVLHSGRHQSIEVEVLSGPITAPSNGESANRQVIPLTFGEGDLGFMVIDWEVRSPARHARSSLINTFGHAVAASIANTRYTQRIARQAAVKARQAEHDPLTGLGNRTMLSEHGPQVVSESMEIGRMCALLLLDLDGFKRINDTLGHAAGDEVIKVISQRLKSSIRRGDLAIRLGGDEFAVLAVDLLSADDAAVVGEKIAGILAEPIEIQDLSLTVDTSIGIALAPEDGTDIEALLKRADVAMYQAKALGRSQTFRYDPTIDHNTTELLRLTGELREALNSPGELVLHYQPQVDVRTNEVVGVEALVRWNHPTDGLLYPDAFIPLVERSSMVRPFTITILELALRDRAKMRELMPQATVSVNLSALNLLDNGLPAQVEALLRRYDVSPEELVLEVTETSTAQDIIGAQRVLTELAALGCQVAMDDFGSGYATIESLRGGSPVAEIKIDRAFIKDITTVTRDRAVANAIIDIAHAWDCRVVAEGIEDEQTYLLLREMGCDVAQGYWLSRPAPLDHILSWVSDRTGRSWPLSLRISAPDARTSLLTG